MVKTAHTNTSFVKVPCTTAMFVIMWWMEMTKAYIVYKYCVRYDHKVYLRTNSTRSTHDNIPVSFTVRKTTCNHSQICSNKKNILKEDTISLKRRFNQMSY